MRNLFFFLFLFQVLTINLEVFAGCHRSFFEQIKSNSPFQVMLFSEHNGKLGTSPEIESFSADLVSILIIRSNLNLKLFKDTARAVAYMQKVVFSILIGNADMHLKNWSLIYTQKNRPSLAPAYDLVSTIPYLDDSDLALNFIRSKKMSDISRDLFSQLAAKAKLSEKIVLSSVDETVSGFHEAWETEKRHLPMSSLTVKKIEAHLRTLSL